MRRARANCRPFTGPRANGVERASYERVMLERLIQEVRPTPAELRRCKRAAERWGQTDPTPSDIMGDRPRGGLESIVSLLATGVQ